MCSWIPPQSRPLQNTLPEAGWVPVNTESLIPDLQPAALQAQLSAFPELICKCSAGTDHYIQNVTDTKVHIYLRSLFHSPPKSYPDATSAQSQKEIKTWLRNKSWSTYRLLTVPSKWELIPSSQTSVSTLPWSGNAGRVYYGQFYSYNTKTN